MYPAAGLTADGRRDPPASLTESQAHAVTHPGGPLLVLGAAGTGKTTVLVERFAWLVSQGVAPEAILALSPSSSAAAALRRRIEDALQRPYEELAVHSVRELSTRLLRDEGADAGVDPFFAPVTRADLFLGVAVALVLLGVVRLLFTRDLVRRVVALNIAGSGVLLVLVAVSVRSDPARPDPVPQALVLTGIVVTVSVTAVALGLVRRIEQVPDDEDEQ